MGVVQLPDEVMRVIEAQVSMGRAPDVAAFVVEATARLVADWEGGEDAAGTDEAMLAAARAGIADIEAGRFVTIEDGEGVGLWVAGILEELRRENEAGSDGDRGR